MQNTSRRDLLAGLAALPAAFSQTLLDPARPAAETAEQEPASAAPGKLRVTPPNQSVMRRG